MEIKEYPDREMLVIDVANAIVGDLKTALVSHESATFVVPGGTTPAPIFDMICAADLEWERVHVLLSDERWVPADHPRSNAGLLRAHLLINRAAKAQFTPFYVENEEVEQACLQLSQQLTEILPVSVAMLGMGADMHSASLFPNARGLAAALQPHAQALCPIQAQGQEQRVTLSANALNSALAKHIVIFGEEKHAALQQAIGADPETAPVCALLEGSTVHWAA